MDYLEQTKPSDVITHLLLERRAAEQPKATFFTLHNRPFTFAEVNSNANVVARHLQSQGITAGSRVAVIMETSAEYMYLWFALSKLGAVEIPINTAYHGDLLRHVLRSSEATIIVADDKFATAIDAAGTQQFGHIFVLGEGSRTPLPGAKRFQSLLLAGNTENLDSIPRHDEVTCIIFTSGTTGPSKGVLLSHHYLTAYGLMYAEINALKDDDVVMNFLPFFHIAAKFLTIAALACGGRMLLQPRLSISSFWQEVRAHGITNFIGVGGICNMLISRPPAKDDADTSIRTIYAVPDPAEIHQEIERRFGCQVTTVYGSTEVGLPLFRKVGDAYRPGSCGRISPYYDVAIVDVDDNPVPVGVTGEIVVRPKRPFLIGSGYVGMPERTIEAWRNLWLHSGDRGHVDEDGWFYFDDRASDSIRRRGENISSFEVEQIVAKHPAVSEAVAVATPSEIGEDEVWVLVILREGHSLAAEDLFQHCYKNMPYFMVPRFIDIGTEFPRTSTAKVEKYKIRSIGPGKSTWDREAFGWKVTRDALEMTTPSKAS